MPFEDRATREARYDQTARRYRERYRGSDTHAELLNVFRRLKADLKDAGGDLDADSVRDWPSDGDVPAAELTLFDQFMLLYARASRLAKVKNVIAAEVLRRRVRNLIADAHRSTAGFKAPATSGPSPVPGSERTIVIIPKQTIVPPMLIREAIEKVRPLTPRNAPLARPQPGDSPEVTQERWRIGLWAQEIEG